MFDRCRLLKTVLLNKKNHLEIVYGTKPITCMIPIFTLCNTPPPFARRNHTIQINMISLT